MLTTERPRIKVVKMKSVKSDIVPHDHSPELKRLSRIKGQIEGVEKMIRDKRYCPDIVQQIKAARAALNSLENNVIEAHIKHCVKTAILSKDVYVAAEKIEEIIQLIKGKN